LRRLDADSGAYVEAPRNEPFHEAQRARVRAALTFDVAGALVLAEVEGKEQRIARRARWDEGGVGWHDEPGEHYIYSLPHHALLLEAPDLVKALVDAGLDFEELVASDGCRGARTDGRRESPLDPAACLGWHYLQLVMPLADPNIIVNNIGESVLHVCTACGDAASVRVLLDAQADPNLLTKDDDGETPLSCVGTRKPTGALLAPVRASLQYAASARVIAEMTQEVLSSLGRHGTVSAQRALPCILRCKNVVYGKCV
jgi:hypothetical protein